MTNNSPKLSFNSKSVFTIAEMSGNHNGELARALALVEAAAKAGANAIKLQTYKPETMTLNISEREFKISNPKSLWNGRTLFDLYSEASTPWDWHGPIFELANKLGLVCFSSPFDATAVDYLESLGCPIYKIASFEIVDIPLIQKAAKTGKPMIISTGMASLSEIELALETAIKWGCPEVALLKCTSSYPASPSNSNLLTIPDLHKRFGTTVGLSDHTLGIGVACASVALGASIIEKHLTLSRADGGVDSEFSLEPHEFAQMVQEISRARDAMGQVQYGPTDEEKGSLQFRRSVYIVENVEAGDVVSEKNIRCIRPSLGLSPKFYAEVLGRRFTKAFGRGTPLKLEDLV